MWMNVLLFVPGGLFLMALWLRRWLRLLRYFLTVLLLTGLSFGIEAYSIGMYWEWPKRRIYSATIWEHCWEQGSMKQ